MTPYPPITRLVIASHNRGKLAEIAPLVQPYGIETVSAGDLRLPEPDETGTSFRANAELKALAAAEGAGLPALSDDSGLVIPALDGAPGIYSARWAGPMKDFSVAIGRVSAELERLRATDFSAHFVCALSLAWPGGPLVTVEGTVQGTLVLPPRGKRGFGYDPIFMPNGYDLTFGEMEPEIKHRISHRADAFAQLVAQVFG